MESNTSIFLKEKPPYDEVYTIILSPGTVRYLKFVDFLKADVEGIINELKQLSSNPEIKHPGLYMSRLSKEDLSFYDEFQRFPDNKPFVQFSQIDNLVGDESWEVKLRVHHVFGYFFLNKNLSSDVYCEFHLYLDLGKHFAFDECAASWVAKTIDDLDLAESYQTSDEHLVIFLKRRHDDGVYCVFKLTDFVKSRLEALAQIEDERSVLEETEKLKKSQFSTFVDIMQDMRNGAFKIGHSMTPGKRERTLQSEVPEIVLRFSVPGEESHERELYEHFDYKNIRGEWFSLTPDELMWVISFLKIKGDAERASVDFEWLGKISFQASA